MGDRIGVQLPVRESLSQYVTGHAGQLSKGPRNINHYSKMHFEVTLFDSSIRYRSHMTYDVRYMDTCSCLMYGTCFTGLYN